MVMALADALQTLLRLPGSTYSCVVERDSGRVLAELGSGEAGTGDSEGVVPYSVPRWGTAVAAMFDSTSGDELDDVMITGRRSYHLVRPLGPGATVLVYLRLDRSRSNLAAARRELAAVRLSAGPAPAEPAAARSAEPQSRGSAPRPRRKAVPSTPPTAAASSAAVPPRTPASAAVPGRTSAPAPSRSPTSVPSRTPASLAPPTTPGRGLASTPPAPSASPAAGSARPRRAAEPVAARRIPLPRRAPGRSATDLGARRSDAGSRAGVATAPGPAPAGVAVPAVLGQSWARDPSTLRRLLAGLRRMS